MLIVLRGWAVVAGWDRHGTTLLYAGKIPQIKCSIKEVPRSILMARFWAIRNHISKYKSLSRLRRSFVRSMCSGSWATVRGCAIILRLTRLVHCGGRGIGMTRLMPALVLRRHVVFCENAAFTILRRQCLYVDLEHVATIKTFLLSRSSLLWHIAKRSVHLDVCSCAVIAGRRKLVIRRCLFGWLL